jgi:Protein of unknown function DUF115
MTAAATGFGLSPAALSPQVAVGRATEYLQVLLAARADAEAAHARALGENDADTARLLARGLAEIAPILATANAGVLSALARDLVADPWDLRRDLIVLVGRGATALGEVLSKLGQKRIFCLDPGAPHVPPTSQDMAPVVNGRTAEELEQACWWLAWPHPAAFRVRAIGEEATAAVALLAGRLERTLRALDQAGHEIETSSYLFLHCATRNLERLATVPSIDPLARLFSGRLAVVVSAGPSLDKNIHLLKQLQGRAVIIAINQTVAALRRVGVRPDLVVAVDPQNLTYQFEGVLPGDIGTLCLGASVTDSLFDVPADQVVTFASSPMPEGWIYETMGDKAALQSGGTVATAAIQIALHLGCSPVVLIGRDLALAGRRYYADGVADGGQELALADDGQAFHLGQMKSKLRLAPAESSAALAERLAATRIEPVEVPGFYGTPVVSYPGFLFEMDILRAIVQRERSRARFINSTEGGAFLDGMEHLPLAEVIAAEAPTVFDPRAEMARALGSVDLPARHLRLRSGLAEMAADMRRAVHLGRSAATLAARAGLKPPRKLARTAEALDAISQKHPILAVLTQRTVRDVTRKDRQGWDSIDEVIAAEVALYRSLANVAQDLAARLAPYARPRGPTS